MRGAVRAIPPSTTTFAGNSFIKLSHPLRQWVIRVADVAILHWRRCGSAISLWLLWVFRWIHFVCLVPYFEHRFGGWIDRISILVIRWLEGRLRSGTPGKLLSSTIWSSASIPIRLCLTTGARTALCLRSAWGLNLSKGVGCSFPTPSTNACGIDEWFIFNGRRWLPRRQLALRRTRKLSRSRCGACRT